MKFREIFSTGYTIQLAQRMAERQQTMNPQDTIRRLFNFGVIGFGALVTIVVAVLLTRSSFGGDANARTFFVFTSFVSALVVCAAIGASLVFLWDGFIGQYIQRLALEDIQAEPEVDREPIASLPLAPSPAETPHVPANDATGADLELELSLSVSGQEFLRANDVSTHLLDRQLETLKRTVPQADWHRYHFEASLQFFRRLAPTATVNRCFTQQGRLLIAQLIPMLSNPATIHEYGLLVPISRMLSLLPNMLKVTDTGEQMSEQARTAL